jgi:TRAP-type C4-dicarboxylate transport system permease large subunit
MSETYKGVVPFLISDAIRMTLLILFPVLTLWLVRVADCGWKAQCMLQAFK